MPALARRRQPPPPKVQTVRLPAPVGGINSVDVGTAMPATDSIWAYNLIADQLGLRVRNGYREWCTTLTGAADNVVRSVLPFSGGALNGASDRLFATTTSGIWDCSSSSSLPSLVQAFGTVTGEAGYGVSTVVATPAGRFLLYCDEENGLYVYSEASTTWTKVALGVTQPWQPSTAYLVGNQVVSSGNTYTCTTAGTSSSGAGPSSTGAGVADGSVVWTGTPGVTANAIGPSLADQQAGFSGNPANFAFVTVWKSRVWLVEKNSSRAWYLGVNSIFGTATSFDFGSRMRAGGPLVGLYGWSYDAGNGLDTLLVGLSTAGDVVIYQGTDPTSASTFSIKGSWFVNGVPYGRRIATDFGGDLLILSLLGVVPLSKLIVGQPVVAGDRSLYQTGKIGPKFNLLAQTYASLRGWSILVHPLDNTLLVTVPQASGQPTIQLAMSLAKNGSWGQYRDFPLYSAATWNGKLYLGTTDGRVCVSDVYVDNVPLANNSFSPVAWSFLSAFQSDGPASKMVTQLQPTILSQTPTPAVAATAKYDFDISEPAPPAGFGSATPGTWDNATWDNAQWGGDYVPYMPLLGASGCGRAVAVCLQGSAISRTTVVGVDVFYEEAGAL